MSDNLIIFGFTEVRQFDTLYRLLQNKDYSPLVKPDYRYSHRPDTEIRIDTKAKCSNYSHQTRFYENGQPDAVFMHINILLNNPGVISPEFCETMAKNDFAKYRLSRIGRIREAR